MDIKLQMNEMDRPVGEKTGRRRYGPGDVLIHEGDKYRVIDVTYVGSNGSAEVKKIRSKCDSN